MTISNDPRGCGCPDCTGEREPFATDTIPPTERNPVGAAEHDLEVLATASAVRSFLESHPELQEPGYVLILGDLVQATDSELSAMFRWGLISHDLSAENCARLTPLGEQVRDYLRARNG